MRERIKVIAAKVEECELDERVDVIISEPMGYMLVNERMLESFIHARRFLKPGGRMFPTRADLHFALFSDNALYLEQVDSYINRRQLCVFYRGNDAPSGGRTISMA